MSASSGHRGRRRVGGFTMIEVMAAVLLTSIVISVAVAFQINLGWATRDARERLRTQRQAVALLDRISRDLAGAYFIAPGAGRATAAHPWIFLTARHFSEEGGSDAIKFVTRNYQPQGLDGHASDLAVVAYYLNPVEDTLGFQLMRWREIHLPQSYDPTFPELDDPDADVIGENLASFTITMIDDGGGEVSEWNSLRKKGPQALPVGVRLEITMLDPNRARADEDALDGDFAEDEDAQAETYAKTVILPLRPLDWTFLESDLRAAGAARAGAQGDEADPTGGGDSGFDGDNGFDGDSNDDFDDDNPRDRRFYDEKLRGSVSDPEASRGLALLRTKPLRPGLAVST